MPSELATLIRNRLREKMPKSSITFAGEPVSTRSTLRGVIRTNIDVLNNYIFSDIGGVPLGRMGEVYAEEGRGKSSLGFEIIASAQRQGGVGVLIEVESTFERSRAEALGVDCDSLVLCEPTCLEEVLSEMDNIFDVANSTQEHPVVIVWDSLASTPTAGEIADGMQDAKNGVAERGRLFARALRVMSMRAAQTGVAVIVINQTRTKIGVVFGDPTTTPTSGVLKFHCAWRLAIQGGTAVKEGEETIGIETTIYSKKNKLSPEKRKFRARLLFDGGWDRRWMVVNFAKDTGVLAENTKVSNKAMQAALTALAWPGGEADTSYMPTFENVAAPTLSSFEKKKAVKKGAK